MSQTNEFIYQYHVHRYHDDGTGIQHTEIIETWHITVSLPTEVYKVDNIRIIKHPETGWLTMYDRHDLHFDVSLEQEMLKEDLRKERRERRERFTDKLKLKWAKIKWGLLYILHLLSFGYFKPLRPMKDFAGLFASSLLPYNEIRYLVQSNRFFPYLMQLAPYTNLPISYYRNVFPNMYFSPFVIDNWASLCGSLYLPILPDAKENNEAELVIRFLQSHLGYLSLYSRSLFIRERREQRMLAQMKEEYSADAEYKPPSYKYTPEDNFVFVKY